MAEVQRLSQTAYERLKADHDDLTTRGRIDIARKIESAREMGDLSENGDYHAAKEEQGKMEGRIALLKMLLRDVEIVDNISGDTVDAGCVVGIRYQGDAEDAGGNEGEDERDALFGAKVGHVVKYLAPGGESSVEVVSIEA